MNNKDKERLSLKALRSTNYNKKMHHFLISIILNCRNKEKILEIKASKSHVVKK